MTRNELNRLTFKQKGNKVKSIKRRAKCYGIKTNALKVYQNEIEYIKENKDEINYNEAIEHAMNKLIDSDDLTKLFDKRSNKNKNRIENIKKTIKAGGFTGLITNQTIIDYIENIENLINNISLLNNLPSEQVGEIYLKARNKHIPTKELIDLINESVNSTNTYSRFMDILNDLIEEYED